MTSVVIPDSVTRIGIWAFGGCDHLADIYYMGSEAEWDAIYKKNAYVPDDATIHFDSETLS